MKTYKGVVVFRYYQEMTVEVEDEEALAQAEQQMLETFNLAKADGEGEVLDLEEVK